MNTKKTRQIGNVAGKHQESGLRRAERVEKRLREGWKKMKGIHSKVRKKKKKRRRRGIEPKTEPGEIDRAEGERERR